MSATRIDILRMGVCNCYLIREDGMILVDAGPPNQLNAFIKKLEEFRIEPQDIPLILLTHGHWDHIGSAKELRTLTGAKVAINFREQEWVEQALKQLPPGVGPWGKVLALLARAMSSSVKFPGSPVDMALTDETSSLSAFGIRGKILHTPGHTAGSMSLLLDTGDAFVGDLAMNGLPMRLGPGVPLLAEDPDAVPESWRRLLDHGAKRFFPSHGDPLPAAILAKVVARRPRE